MTIKRVLELYEEMADIQEKVLILYESDYIEDNRCQGIARQIISQGTSLLTDKQKYLYKTYIKPLFATKIKHCNFCQNKIIKEYSYSIGLWYWCNEICFEKELN